MRKIRERDHVRVAAIQFDVKSGDKESNLSKVDALLAVATRNNARIAAMPEYFSTGFPITKETVTRWSEPIPGPTTERMAELAKKYKMYILGSILEKENGEFYAACPVLDPHGTLIGKHRKVNLWMMHPADEVGSGLKFGEDYPVFKTEAGKIAILLGDDFAPEPTRICALKGADVIFYLTAIDYPWIDAYRAIGQTFAMVNMTYVVSANRTGIFDNMLYFGDSRIINPMGEVIASAGTSYGTWMTESITTATLNIKWLREIRRQPWNPLRLRKPDTYGLLTKTKKELI